MMPYIDATYYSDEYKGTQPNNPMDIDKNIQRASEMIDMLTHYRLTGSTVYHSSIMDRVKRATAVLTEYYILNGGYEAFAQDGISSAGLGSFNYSVKNGSSGSSNIPSNAMEILISTGLLYAGIDWYEANSKEIIDP